jgi:translation elongation factor EF-Tu-like GTPase
MFRSKHRSILAATAVALSVAACSKQQADKQANAEPVAFKAQALIPVKLALLKAEGPSGRTSPISSNYRPQVRFASGEVESSCTVQLPAAAPSLEPGQTANASLSCEAEVWVERAKPEFLVFEGGKQVGNGIVQLP